MSTWYTLQERRSSGWHTLRYFRREATALGGLAATADNTPGATLRVAILDSRGWPVDVIGSRG